MVNGTVIEKKTGAYTNSQYLADIESVMQAYVYRYYLKTRANPGSGNGRKQFLVPLNNGGGVKAENDLPSPQDSSFADSIILNGELNGVEKYIREKQYEINGRIAEIDCGEIRLEKTAQKYGLDDFEKKVVTLIFLSETNASFRRSMNRAILDERNGRRSDMITVGDALSVLCSTYEETLERRKYFSLKSRLVSLAIIELDTPTNEYFGYSTNVFTLALGLPAILSNYIIGDDNDYLRLDKGLEISEPCVDLTNVILEKGIKEDLEKFVNNYGRYRENIKRYGIDKVLGYGMSTVFLFHGPTGTGKTMLANAIAAHMKKKIITTDMSSLSGNTFSEREGGRKLKRALRKAEIMDAVLFIDELEEIFARDRDESREFLIEIEKHNVIVILAANNLERLDPATERRINYKIEFKLPGPEDRKKIWEVHFPDTSILAPNVDFGKLAYRFIFTGGYIKNAALNAVSNAALQTCGTGIKITQERLFASALEIERGMIRPFYLTAPYHPLTDFKDMRIRKEEAEEIRGLSNLISKTEKGERNPIVAFYGVKDEKEYYNIADSIGGELKLPVIRLRYDTFVDDKNMTMAASGYRGEFSAFRQRILKEIKNLDCLLVIVDTKNHMGSPSLYMVDDTMMTIYELNRPTIVLTPSTSCSAVSKYANFEYSFKVRGNLKTADIWQELWKTGVKVEKGVTAKKLEKELSLIPSEIRLLIQNIRMQYHHSGEKPVSFEEIKDAARKHITWNRFGPLFGGKE